MKTLDIISQRNVNQKNFNAKIKIKKIHNEKREKCQRNNISMKINIKLITILDKMSNKIIEINKI